MKKLIDYRKRWVRKAKTFFQCLFGGGVVCSMILVSGIGTKKDFQLEKDYIFRQNFEQKLDQIEIDNRLIEINNRIVKLEKGNETIQETIIRVAKENKLNEAIFRATIQCESGFNPNAKGKNKDGSIDRGVAQFNSKWYSFVSDEQAYNPKVAIEMMGSEWRKGKAGNWVCFKTGKFKKFL